ncbi:MAG: NRDE family protein [Deltaproteobacteria bacterium]|nr:MAG: NRDE family protein [Deltaproteobacteria bacterium]
MCLILFSFNQHPDYTLILAANRDEFFNRPAKPLEFWTDDPSVLAGKDLVGGGTWLGVTRSIRFAAITNFRDPYGLQKNAPTRGNLVRDFLCSQVSPEEYIKQIQNTGHQYNGFSLLVGVKDTLLYYSNRSSTIISVPKGFHGLSNHLLNTPWPKITTGKAKLKPIFSQPEIDIEATFQVLGDSDSPPPDHLPDTGVGLEWERILAPLFIHSDFYGTRCSSLLTIKRTGEVMFIERTFSSEKKRLLQKKFDFCYNPSGLI